MGRYLYGASIQGIQNYIFQTNELKDIIGASELVNEICHKFKTMYGKDSKHKGKMIVHAAGNIKCIFDDEDACRRAVREFPKRAMEMAPGITISQAVVKIENNDDYHDGTEKLESLLRAQRNHPVKSLTTGLMAMERSRKTGLPATTIENTKDKKDKPEYLDEGTVAKRNVPETEKESNYDPSKAKDLYFKLTGDKIEYDHRPYDTKDLTGRNDWIAVIHADGNGLGEIVARIGKDPKVMHSFSTSLDNATLAAAQVAYNAIRKEAEKVPKLPIRPVVIGGDDLTVICCGDLAVDFVTAYLKAFEDSTKEEFKGLVPQIENEEAKKLLSRGLTACAGIAFIKSSYPFYYGYDLAEALCGEAKKDAKSDKVKEANGNQAPSCLMFHKVQSSFVEDYAEIKRKELTTVDGGSLCFGPYYLNKESVDKVKDRERWTIKELSETVDKLNKEDNNRVKTAIRQWLTLMHEDAGAAKQHSKRVKAVNLDSEFISIYDSVSTGIIKKDADGKDKDLKLSPAYDILSLLTIIEQETKPNQETK